MWSWSYVNKKINIHNPVENFNLPVEKLWKMIVEKLVKPPCATLRTVT